MSLRECLERVINEYPVASHENFTRHSLANFIRGELRDRVAQAAGKNERLIFKGSAGQGNWARGPWVGIFDKLVTTSAQSGYYPVYLFRENMGGIYLSLNQGVTEARKLYKSDAKTALRAPCSQLSSYARRSDCEFSRTQHRSCTLSIQQ